MPSLPYLASLLLAGASVVACSGAPGSPAPTETHKTMTTPAAHVALTPEHAAFSLTRGDDFSVGLASAAGGGYQWHLQEGFDARVVRLKGQRSGELPPNAPLGKFADEIFDFEAVGSGETTLVFTLYRVWEGPERAVQTRRHAVTVH